MIKILDGIIGKSMTSRLFEDEDIEGEKDEDEDIKGEKDEDKGRGDDRRGDEISGDMKTIKKEEKKTVSK